MLIPISTDRPLRRPTLVNHALLLLNALVFAICQSWSILDQDSLDPIVRRFGLVWDPNEPWRFVTYAFLHGGWMHFLGNMLILHVFGPAVEDKLGRWGYAALYIVGGIVAGAAHIVSTPAPVIGASGAIAAVTGSYLVFFPLATVKVFLFFIIIGVFHIPALWFIGIAIARDFLMHSASARDQVSHAAHLGGYAFGFTLSLLLLTLKIVPRDASDMFAMFRQAKRRRDIAGAVHEAQARTAKRILQPDEPEQRAIAAARANVSTHLADRNAAGAAAAYKSLLTLHGTRPGAAALSRRAQLEIAEILKESGDLSAAAEAYRQFLAAYPKDPESPEIRLLLAILLGRYLKDPAGAASLITAALPGLDDDHRAMAADLSRELGHPPAPEKTV